MQAAFARTARALSSSSSSLRALHLHHRGGAHPQQYLRCVGGAGGVGGDGGSGGSGGSSGRSSRYTTPQQQRPHAQQRQSSTCCLLSSRRSPPARRGCVAVAASLGPGGDGGDAEYGDGDGGGIGGMDGQQQQQREASTASSMEERLAEADAAALQLPKRKPTPGRQRLDELTCERFPEYSRTVAQSWIAQGKVLVDGQPVTKAGTRIKSTCKLEIIAEVPKYVCRGGLKLEKALQEFGISVEGKVALDSGLSTGGFTDCMLQNGAARVYGIDVGYGQVAERVRVDPRVVVMERTNLRHLQPLPEPVDIATLDLSFISVLKVLPAVAAAMRPGGQLVVLIKPQFEATRNQVGSKGVVRDTKVHLEVIAKVIDGAGELGFDYVRHTESPIKGAKEGNTEFLALFNRNDQHMPWPPPPPAP